MRYYIRTDMNEKIATGHVMRTLAIADALKSQGDEINFILADTQAANLLNSRGYPFIVLNTRWNDMDTELPIIKKEIAERKIEMILIDSYQVTESYLERLTRLTKTIYIDDLNAFAYPVTAVICYANYWEKFSYDSGKLKLYLGPQYTPLRKEFSNCEPKSITPNVENLLLLSGGTDHCNVIDRFLEKIEKKNYRKIDVICGVYYQQYEKLCEKYHKYHNIVMHTSVIDIEKYMKSADIAVSAGGSTLYELCAFGTPTISYSIADNQLDNVKKFQADGLIDYAGDVRWDDIIGNINVSLKNYHDNMQLRQTRSLKMQSLVDGKGAQRIAEILGELKDFGC